MSGEKLRAFVLNEPIDEVATGRGQSLERLCARGGFGIFEYLAFKHITDEMKAHPEALHDHTWIHDEFERAVEKMNVMTNEEIWKLLGPNVREGRIR